MRPRKLKPEARPGRGVTHATDIGNLVAELRKGLCIRQEDLAARAGVGRQWIGELEQGKPTLEVGLVLRTLATLGLELEVRPYDPLPAWLTRARHEVEARARASEARRTARRRSRREQARLMKVAQNAPTVWPYLE